MAAPRGPPRPIRPKPRPRSSRRSASRCRRFRPPRRAALRDLIRGGFDLDLTSRLVLGKFWGRATPKQRTAFKDLFAQYLLNAYARRLDAYRIETLAVVASKRVGENDFLVQTSIVGDGDTANAVWRVRARGGAYRIIDVLIDGISLALTQRSEFTSVIGREGFDGMLTGTILHVVRPRQIVQSWRSALFHAENPDSTLILTFTPEQNQGRIDLVHLDVPEHDYDDVVCELQSVAAVASERV
ncbi:MAG: ABC transporter substrate-binding protein, partial [Proteobacteria bacterium]|nr:ABC transporter substrate-binding protein [Pseudomonadota bacterium]